MATIDSYPVLDFSGGIRRDKSFAELQKNELVDARNVHLDDRGRVRIRFGSHQVGADLSASIDNIFSFVRYATTGVAVPWLIVNTNGTTAVLSSLVSTRLTANVATTDTTITVVSTTATPIDFAATGTIEINGDRITYTGTSGTTFTGCGGINRAHTAGASVNQWVTLTQSGTAVDGRQGIYYAVLNNILFIDGRSVNIKQYDGSNVTDLTGEPSILFITNYRDRLYGVGDGSSNLNGSSRRVSFSARGDGTSWTTASDFFDVEDQNGEPITALKVNRDRLGIFKSNSTYIYDELQLKQYVAGVGAYNHRVVQNVQGRLFTFCPAGIFETTLTSVKEIGLPVKEYWERFRPIFDTVSSRVCTNTYAWTFGDSYFLSVGSLTLPFEAIASTIVLEYSIRTGAWTVHDGKGDVGGWSEMTIATSINDFRYGDRALNVSPAIFGGSSLGQAYRFFDDRYLDSGTPTLRGSDLFTDGQGIASTQNAGATPIAASFETPLYDLTHPELFKKFKRLHVYAESGQWSVEYRVENERGITAYKPLGTISTTNSVLPFPSEAQGWKCGLRISGVNINGTSVFNGFIFEDTEVLPRP